MLFLATALVAVPAAAQSVVDPAASVPETTRDNIAPPPGENPTAAAVSTGLQPSIDNGRQIFQAAQFARFSPRTALDMVAQVPGFAIDTGDDSRRGLGQADQNVLINGQRISGKDNDAFTVLRRIPAGSVVRIEIVDGATLAISGLSGQILNLVTNGASGGKLSGSFRQRSTFRDNGTLLPEGEISLSGRLGTGNFTLSLENEPFLQGGAGPEAISDRRGNILFRRDEVVRAEGDRPELSFHFDRTTANGNILNFDIKGQLFDFTEQVDTRRTQTGAADIFELFQGGEDEWNAEISADYEFALGGGRLKLIGLQRLENSDFSDSFGQSFTDGITPANGSRFDQLVDEGESILRAEYRWRTAGGSDWGISAEGAFNFLDSSGALSTLGSDGIFRPVPLENATSRVEEYRGELLGNWGRTIGKGLTLQLVAGGEYSTISQSGALGQSRSFFRPKGSATLAWAYAPDLDLSLKIERQVGQLNFGDFIASVEVANNVTNAGNPELVPPQSWIATLEANKKLGPWGSLSVTLFGEQISDIVDAVPISATSEARGNLDSATRYGAQLIASILFDPIGWRGAKLDIDARWSDSSLTDPLLGTRRQISQNNIHQYNLTLRHDVPKSDFAWGLGLEGFKSEADIRLDQTADFDILAPFGFAFVEHKDVFGLTVQGWVGNLFGQGERFERVIFVDRRDGPIDFIEDRTRQYGLIYRLTISGTF